MESIELFEVEKESHPGVSTPRDVAKDDSKELENCDKDKIQEEPNEKSIMKNKEGKTEENSIDKTAAEGKAVEGSIFKNREMNAAEGSTFKNGDEWEEVERSIFKNGEGKERLIINFINSETVVTHMKTNM